MIVDIIMPSKTNAALAPIARSCIESLHASEPRDKFAWNVVVVGNHLWQYAVCRSVAEHPKRDSPILGQR